MRRIMVALAAAGVIVVGLAGSAAQAHPWGQGYYGWQWRQHEDRAWSRHERDRHQDRMAAIFHHNVSSGSRHLSHH